MVIAWCSNNIMIYLKKKKNLRWRIWWGGQKTKNSDPDDREGKTLELGDANIFKFKFDEGFSKMVTSKRFKETREEEEV